MAPGGTAPDAILKLMATACGERVIRNSTHLSGATVPQQLPARGTGGFDTQVPFGLLERLQLKKGVLGSQLPDGCASNGIDNTANTRVPIVTNNRRYDLTARNSPFLKATKIKKIKL